MEISLEKIYRIAKKNILWILAAAILFGGIAYAGMKYLVAPTYTTSAQFYISDPNKDESASSTRNYNVNAATTYVAILSTADFFESVYANLPEDLAAKITAGQIRSGTSFSIITDTEVITVKFQSGNRELVYPVMQTIYDSIQERIRYSYNQAIEKRDIETPKENAVSVSSTRTRTTTLIFAVIGALAALLFFYIRDMLDIHIRGAGTIIDKYNLPVLGRVPNFDPALLRKKEASSDGKKDK